MALWFCAGTAGELIKLYPIIRRATARGVPWFALATGQSAINFWKQWDDFRLPRDRAGTLLETDSDLHDSSAALRWFVRANVSFTRRGLLARIGTLAGREPDPRRDAWIVHGDTLSALTGARAGRKLGLPVAHVEAGLRSPSLLKPFPEEITRRLVSRLARWHFTPDARATDGLRREGVRGEIVCTEGNTLYDALHDVIEEFAGVETPPRPYVVANLHRFENLSSASRWAKLVDVMVRAAARRPVHLVQHPPTAEKLRRDDASRERLLNAGVKLLPRLPFTQFVPLLDGSEYVISDGGSNQEECSYLGKPCLLLREQTERVEGLDGSCLLSRMDDGLIDGFLSDPSRWARDETRFPASPSDRILDALEAAA